MSRTVYFGDLKPRDTFILENRRYTVYSVTRNGRRVQVETTAGSTIDEHADTYVEVMR
jgi:hypothetical protein